jgi:hypothetical protein
MEMLGLREARIDIQPNRDEIKLSCNDFAGWHVASKGKLWGHSVPETGEILTS